jgi:hypothetical protein
LITLAVGLYGVTFWSSDGCYYADYCLLGCDAV